MRVLLTVVEDFLGLSTCKLQPSTSFVTEPTTRMDVLKWKCEIFEYLFCFSFNYNIKLNNCHLLWLMFRKVLIYHLIHQSLITRVTLKAIFVKMNSAVYLY